MKYSLPFVRFWRPLTGGLLVLAAPLLLASCQDNSFDDIETLRVEALRRQKEARSADSVAINKYIADSSFTTAQRQPSGLYIIYKNTGTGALPTTGQTASVLYRGSFLDGRVFDKSAVENGVPKPFPFVVGQDRVIYGFNEGISLMRKGQKAILLMPSALAYGPGGNNTIPPNTPLRFDVELVDILQ